MRQITIIVIDPGTTVGWAALSKDGRILAVKSKKGIAPDELTRQLRETGKVIMIGTDKAKIPGLISKISARFKAKIVSPRVDLSKEEKRELTKDLHCSNDHERDALAAARFAQKKYCALFRKIRSYAEKNKLKDSEEKIIEAVLKTGNSIAKSAEAIKTRKENRKEQTGQEQKQIKTKNKEGETKRFAPETILQRENKALREILSKLRKTLKEQSTKLRRLKKKSSQAPRKKPKEQEIQQKEQIIRSLRDSLDKRETELKQAREELKSIEKELMSIEDKIIVKNMLNLGTRAFEKAKEIKKNDIIHVKDPNSFSEKTIKELKEKEIEVIINEKPVSRKTEQILPFIFIPRKEVNLAVYGNIGFLDKKSLEKHKKILVRKIIENYKAERRL
ncbi:MAG TPA: DUF460 domain-containing protein [Candidatus Woesearchaeota archaeon]|nr:DUF460 domain-containing protein [Candidatus Woesearchaeota archaeon]